MSIISEEKTFSKIFAEIEPLQKEIIFYIDNFLPQIYAKKFIFENEEYEPHAIIRQFRLMCLMFNKRLKKYDLDQRERILIFLNPKCCKCGKLDNLQLHHRYKDGKTDREIFDDYEIFIWTYYLIHLDEAHDRLRVLCNDCHDKVHNGSGNRIDDLIMEMFGI